WPDRHRLRAQGHRLAAPAGQGRQDRQAHRAAPAAARSRPASGAARPARRVARVHVGSPRRAAAHHGAQRAPPPRRIQEGERHMTSATRSKLVGLVMLALGGLTSAAQAGVQDSPLPTFSTGRPALLVGMLPSVQSLNNLETLVTCTNLGAGVADIGLEVFDHLGRRANTIANGNGAALNVGVGKTVTIATGHTVAL